MIESLRYQTEANLLDIRLRCVEHMLAGGAVGLGIEVFQNAAPADCGARKKATCHYPFVLGGNAIPCNIQFTYTNANTRRRWSRL